ncbi:MAG: tol-pal system-associated acyl-CoA thioesterase [Pseudomonadota bacterium]
MTTESWPDIAGKIEDGVHRLPVRVYYEDTDFSGAVYHANYLKFCERGRSDCLRLLGVHHHELHWHETEGRMGFVVRRMVCDFLRPARIDDLLVVESRFLALRGARMEIDQRVLRGDEVLFTADVMAALVDGNGRPKRMPAAIAEAVGRHL